MIAVVQRVLEASVTVQQKETARIGKGVLVLLGVEKGDGTADAQWLADKITNLRIFEDEQGKMNLSLLDISGSALVVSQFTLCADCTRGRRPSFDRSAPPEQAERLYESFVERLSSYRLEVQTGVFGARMAVQLLNWGPVTFILRHPS